MHAGGGAGSASLGRACPWREIASAAAVAGSFSGLPSTAWAAITGRGILDATRAAGTLLPGRRDRPGVLAGAVSHVVLSIFWTGVIATVRPRRRLRPVDGAVAGLLIASLDLAVIGRRYPAIRALPAIPQWIDHVAFGALAAACLGRHRCCSGSPCETRAIRAELTSRTGATSFSL